MAEFKMAAIIKLSQNEWVKFILCKMAESKNLDNKVSEWQSESSMAEFKMAAIIKLSEWMSKVYSVQNGWVWVSIIKLN